MKNESKKIIFNEINKLPLLTFINEDLSKKNEYEKVEIVNDLIVRIGCRVDRLYSSLFDFEENDNLSEKARNVLNVFKSLTVFKTKKFTNYLKEGYELNEKRINLISQQASHNNLNNSDDIKLLHRMSDFYFMGFDCSVYIQSLWEQKQNQRIMDEAIQAHKLLTELFDKIRADKMTFQEALNANNSDNKIYNGFILILKNINDLDSRSFSIEKNLKSCEVCKKYFFAETQNRKFFCSSTCSKKFEKENY